MTVTNIDLNGNIASSLSVLRERGGYFLANEYGLLNVCGKDAAEFLQSQLSNNIHQLQPGSGQFTCLLDRKAHILAYFHLFRGEDPSDNIFHILAEVEQLPIITRQLEEYRFAAQVEFSNKGNDGKFIAIEGPRINKLFTSLNKKFDLGKLAQVDTFDTICDDYKIRFFRHSITGENGYFFWVANNDYAGFSKLLVDICHDSQLAKLSDQAINTARIEAGQIKFGVDFDKEFLLPETGLSETTVSYTKGCFTGQEVLARVKSHGLPAKALIGLNIEIDQPDEQITTFPINSPLLVTGQEIGLIKSNAYSPTLNKLIAFALLKRDYRVPGKTLCTQIAGQSVRATVSIPPFIKSKSSRETAHSLYENAIQQYAKAADDKEPTESIHLLKEALSLDPKFEDAYEALAVILGKYDKLAEAIGLMKKLCQLNTDSIMAHSNLSQFYMQQGNKELAEEEKAIALGIRMKLAAAEAMSAQKQKEQAGKDKEETKRRKEMFEQVLAIDAEDFFANAGLGECLVDVQEYEKAISYLKKAIELKPIHLQAYLALAKAYQGVGSNSAAKETLEEGKAIAAKRGDMAMLQHLSNEITAL